MITKQTNAIFMVRNNAFAYNAQTASSNDFQNAGKVDINKVLKEFDNAVIKLADAGIDVSVFHNNNAATPDAIFPNNWIAVMPDKIILFPMMAINRRLERNPTIINKYLADNRQLFDLTDFENTHQFLEGTGSVVFNHQTKQAFCALSERSHPKILNKLCELIKYEPVLFETSFKNQPVYHTNVLMSIGNGVAVMCKEIIIDKYLPQIDKSLESLQRLFITTAQMQNFAGNVIALQSEKTPSWVMSQSAYKCLQKSQRLILEKTGQLVIIEVGTIEFYGGGGIRCMIAEVFS